MTFFDTFTDLTAWTAYPDGDGGSVTADGDLHLVVAAGTNGKDGLITAASVAATLNGQQLDLACTLPAPSAALTNAALVVKIAANHSSLLWEALNGPTTDDVVYGQLIEIPIVLYPSDPFELNVNEYRADGTINSPSSAGGSIGTPTLLYVRLAENAGELTLSWSTDGEAYTAFAPFALASNWNQPLWVSIEALGTPTGGDLVIDVDSVRLAAVTSQATFGVTLPAVVAEVHAGPVAGNLASAWDNGNARVVLTATDVIAGLAWITRQVPGGRPVEVRGSRRDNPPPGFVVHDHEYVPGKANTYVLELQP